MTTNAKQTLKEGDLLWTPTTDRIKTSEMTRFMRWLATERNLVLEDYEALRQWSVNDIEAFWAAFWDFYEIQSSAPYQQILSERTMPGAKWFQGAKLNFAEHALRHRGKDAAAMYFASETTPLTTISWDELRNEVTDLAYALRQSGVQPGDRVVGFMPNIPQTMIACLAAASVGAIWSGCAPDFGATTVLDRFQQIQPRVLFTVDGYRYGGKDFERSKEVQSIVKGLPSLEKVVYLPYLNPEAVAPVEGAVHWNDFVKHVANTAPQFEQLDFDHPLWVVYSSGTTGLPKAIVHGHGGITLELHKMLGLHSNLQPDTRMFFYGSSGWIMWNILMGALLVGASPVLYDGHPSAPEADVLWRIASETRTTLFGASPTYLAMMQKAGIVPKEQFDFSSLEGVLLTGSPATPESMQWLYDNVKSDLWVTSQSGGTDVASAFVNGSCNLPVYAGEIQARSLGVDIQAFNDSGEPVVNEVGELVITQPMPSMPLYFWNDTDDRRYKESYFEPWPGVWRHGDFFELNDRGGCFIRGRSDSTLNRYGVRIGTAEIYRCVEALEEVDDSMVINLDLPAGKFFMPMFIKVAEGHELNDALRTKIKAALKTQCSPRHVPDALYAVDAIPYTLTGKKLEVPVRKILMGAEPNAAVSRDAMLNPSSIDSLLKQVLPLLPKPLGQA
ncbi:MAG: acetoacetate--CoA ligase [Salinisphaeraceae bacterium]|nr:acetoacetate--CoA ligase [Salinisphaeraceae bacterium]